MPPRVRRAFPPFGWTEDALWALDVPAEEVPLRTFDWLLDLPVWRWEGRRFRCPDVADDGLQAHLEEPSVQGHIRLPTPWA